MDILNTGILDLAEQRLGWLDRRQQLLAQNVANADTPQYRPSDLPPFAASLRSAAAGGTSAGDTSLGTPAGTLAQTAPGHMAGTVAAAVQRGVQQGRARAPDGNAVSLDEELTKVADTQNMQSLTTGLYTKYLGLFRLALGRAS